MLGLSEGGDRPRHAAELLPAVEAAVEDAGGWSGVDLIAVGLGPGSFTGIRIGVATARALSAALGVPAVGACTLEALALGMRERAGARPLLAVTDARRGELFAAAYGPDGALIREPFLTGPDGLLEAVSQLDRPPLAAGSGTLGLRAQLADRGAEIPEESDPAHRIAARHTCSLAVASGGGEDGPPEPIYLRPPDAERWRERNTSPKTDG